MMFSANIGQIPHTVRYKKKPCTLFLFEEVVWGWWWVRRGRKGGGLKRKEQGKGKKSSY